MKILCTQENLAGGLDVGSRVASKNITLPILNNVVLIAEGGVVRLQTTNLEIAVTTTIRAKIETEGRYTAQSRLLNDVVHLMKDAKITLETTPGGLVVSSEESTTTIKGLPPEEFPVPPTVGEGTEFAAPDNSLETRLQEVVFAAASDESRPEISGVFFMVEHDTLVVAATDSYRLSERRLKLSKNSPHPRHGIIPARSCQEILRILHDGGGEVTIRVDEQQICWRTNETEVVSRLIEGQYPEYKQIIPANWTTRCVVDRQGLIDAVRAASLFCQPGINDITATVTEHKLQLTAANTQTGQHIGHLEATTDGPGVVIVFNYRYLLEGAQSLKGDTIHLELNTPQSPGVLRGKVDPVALYLIMPIRQ